MKIDSLTIHDHTYSSQSLSELCNSRIRNDDTPSWEKEVYAFLLQWLDDSDTIVQYSPGTTGKSKMIRLQKLAMIQSAESTCRFFNLKRGTNGRVVPAHGIHCRQNDGGKKYRMRPEPVHY